MRVSAALACLMLALTAVACYREPVAATQPPATTTPTPTPTLQPTPIPTSVPTAEPALEPTPQPSPRPIDLSPTGAPAADCINGWVGPAPGTPEYEDALAILSTQMGVEGAWVVDEMRYFTGPELPNVEPQYESVERWYVRAALADDPTFRARWIIERRTNLILGISAVAPYDSTGYESPDWTAFVGEGEPVSYLGLPGQWAGIPYDFVTGEGDSGNPGLPAEIVGCLSGT